MIVCPNCGKEISEDAAHCGHCGARIEQQQKKTMIGVGAIDSEKLKEASNAGAASFSGSSSSADDEPEDQQGGRDPSLAATEVMEELKLPEPDGDDGGDGDEGESSDPEPNDAEGMATGPTMAMDTVDRPAVTDDDGDAGDAEGDTDAAADNEGWEIGALDQSDEAASFDDQEPSGAPAADADDPSFVGDQATMEEDIAGADASDDPDRLEEPTPPDGAELMAAADDTEPSDQDQKAAFQAGDRFAGGGDGFDADAEVDTQSSSAGGNEKSRRRRLLIFIAVIFFAIAGCCTVTTVSLFVFGGDALEEVAEELEEEIEEELEEAEEWEE